MHRLQYLLLLWGLSLAGLCAASDPTVEKEKRLCGHGIYNERNLSCDCDDGWRHAGITDTLNYVKGVCTQFSCTSSEECQERLGIPGAKCDIKGWDCYCGWSWAFKGPSISFGLSPGYQTWGKHGAACQGPLFTLSFWMTGNTLWALASFWKAIFFCTVACLPLGSTKVRCQCYDPGMFRLVLALSGHTATCDGQCTVARQTQTQMLYYDLAWSIYVIDVGIWIYAFLLLAWMTFLVAWGIVIWLVVLVALLVAAVMACSGGGEVSAENMPDCSGDGCCMGLTNCCQGFGQTGPVPDSVFFYAGGPSPTTDWGCDPCGSCYALGRCWLCAPLAYIFLHFPRRPANMWGGVVGYALLGTHPASPRPYTGGNRIVDFLGFRSDHDLHANEDWRVRVAEFLQVRQQAPQQQEMGTVDVAPQPPQGSSSSIPVRSNSFKVEGRRVSLVLEPFDRDRDNCRNSSYEDYAKRDCWICCDSKESPEWDLWLQCGHLFCKRCSTEMLRRKLPCPLCRQVSWHVKRGPAAYAPPSLSSP